MKLRIAPSEPPSLKATGVVSSAPEMYGVDVLWQANGRLYGIQRKEIDDLVSSARDGRLQRLMTDMRDLDQAMFLIEGRPSWTNEGVLLNGYSKWTVAEHVGVVLGMQAAGVWVVNTASLQETVIIVGQIASWTAKTSHSLLTTRPQPPGDDWGNVTKRQRQEFLLQGLPGVGVDRARRIIDAVGFPIGLTVTDEELLKVDGIGKGTVRKMREALA